MTGRHLPAFARGWCARLLLAALFFAACGAPARAAATELAPGEGRLSLLIDGAVPMPQRHLRQDRAGSTCETISWDGGEFFGEVTHCQALDDRFWRRGTIDIDLLLDRFAFLGDFLVTAPQAHREIASGIGPMTLYAFSLEDVPGQESGCNGFVQGYDAAGMGYRAYLIGYACADRSALDDRRADALLRGLSLRGGFASLMP